MKRLTDELKKMLTGLAYQDAGEFLPMRAKSQTLGRDQKPRGRPNPEPRKQPERAVTRRIAFITDGSGLGTPLDYAINACLRQDAQIDLLVHGTTDRANIAAMKQQVQRAGLGCQITQLGMNPVEKVISYSSSHSSLLLIVSTPGDTVTKALMEDVIPQREGRIHAPLVLIGGSATTGTAEKSATQSVSHPRPGLYPFCAA